MISLEDCIAMSGLSREEVDAIAEHEHLPEAAAAALAGYLMEHEAHGLPATVSALADHRIVIPMPGATESLNVAAAAAICLYQSARAQRNLLG